VELSGNDELERAALASALDVAGDDAASRAHVHGFHSYPARMHPDDGAKVHRDACRRRAVSCSIRFAAAARFSSRDVSPGGASSESMRIRWPSS
jgi:hypothetical protein